MLIKVTKVISIQLKILLLIKISKSKHGNQKSENCSDENDGRRDATLLRRRVALGDVAVADRLDELVLDKTQTLAVPGF
jgi:hypothetical protein